MEKKDMGLFKVGALALGSVVLGVASVVSAAALTRDKCEEDEDTYEDTYEEETEEFVVNDKFEPEVEEDEDVEVEVETEAEETEEENGKDEE